MKKILVVDDEPFNVEILKGLLSKKYDVETAANGEEAFTKVKQISPDLILLDVIMPEIDGYEVCRQLKSDQKTRNIPIVMVTCLTDRNDRIKAIEAGADDFLSKPIDWIELGARVKSLIRIKQYLEDLEESKNRYIKLYDFAPVGYFTFTRNGLILEVNLTGGVLLGLRRQELMKREFRNFVVPEDLELLDRHISSALNNWDEQSCELTIKREDGSTLFVRLNSIQMETGKGTPEIFTAITDITQRKQIEEELQKRAQIQKFINKLLQISLNDLSLKEILEQILDHLITLPWIEYTLQGGIWIVEDEPDVLVLVSQRRLDMLLQTLCGRIPFGKCICGRCASTGEIQYTDHVDEKHEVRYKNMPPHGHYCIPLVFSGKVIGVLNLFLKEGRPKNSKEEDFLKTFADVVAGIIQRKKTETELKRSNDFMSTVLNSIDDAICIIDVQDHKILGFNSAFQKEAGLEEKHIIGEHCYKITHNNAQPCGPPDGVCALLETLRTGKHAVVEHLHYGANGKKIYLEVSTSPVRNEMGRIIKVVHTTRNTTERMLAEEHLKQVNIELKRADELKTQFLSVISHEMRTPLTPMNAQLQMMLAGYFGEITEKHKKSLEMILRNTGRLDRLIGDVLDFSKLESGVMKFNMVPASMKEIVENTVETMKIHALNKNLKITLKEEQIPLITIDKDRITQVILNLIHNAIKFTDAGGVIEVELSCNAKNVTVKVKDTGIGIGTEDIDKLFKPFQQLDSSYGRKYEGSGLGLVICNRIIINHGGKIWVESEFGKGTAFIISIPFIHEVKEEKVESKMFEDGKK